MVVDNVMGSVQTIGEKIRALRLGKGLNQTELAKGIVTASMISQIEYDRAKPSHGVLTQIAERLDCSLEDLIGNTALNFKTASQFNMAKALVIKGEFSSALCLLEDLSARNDSDIEPFEIAYYHVYCYIQLQMLNEASVKLKSLSDPFDAHESKYNFAKVEYLLGLVEMKKRCYPLAEHHFHHALHALNLSKVNDEGLKSSALMELGKAQWELGKLTASLEAYRQASHLFETRADYESLGHAYLQMAQSCLEANQLRESGACAQRAFQCLDAVSNTHTRLIMELRIAVIQASTGNRANAELNLQHVAEELVKIKKADSAGIAYAELSKLFFESQRLDLAEEAAEAAKQFLPPMHEQSALSLRVLAKIAQARKQTDAASKLFEQSADCYRSVGRYKEYEFTMQELSNHYAQLDDVHMAYKVFSDMLTFNLHTREARGIM